MSHLSSREKRLALVIFGLLFVFGNVITFRWWGDKLEGLKKEKHHLEMALIEAEALYEERSDWENKQRWLDSVILPFSGREAVDVELLKLIETSANEVNVIIESSELLEPLQESSDHFSRAGVSVRASGTLPQLAKWIYGIQEPEDIRSLMNFEFETDGKNPGIIKCQFQCWEWRKKLSQQSDSGVAER